MPLKLPNTLKVQISSATKALWRGEAQSCSSVNSEGPFDILPMHANFITLVQNAPLTIITGSGESLSYHFKEAVIYVKDNEVRIYSDFT